MAVLTVVVADDERPARRYLTGLLQQCDGVQIVGEAANRTRLADPEFAARFPEVPWDAIYGLRNRIVQDYFEVDLEIVWQTVQQDLPSLRRQIEELLKHANKA